MNKEIIEKYLIAIPIQYHELVIAICDLAYKHGQFDLLDEQINELKNK
jgi:hypothetical protein